MLTTKDPAQNKRSTQVESEGMGTNIPSKQTQKESWGTNTYARQNILQDKSHKKGQRTSLTNI